MKLRNHQISKILVQIGQFQSIDVFQKGYYQMKARLYGKCKTSSGSRRVDAVVCKHLSSSYQELLPLSSDTNNSGFTLSSDTKCTLPHNICNWRCKAAPTASKMSATVWVSKIFYIEYSNYSLIINESLIFEMERVSKLYDSEYHQQDDTFLDLELFFTEQQPTGQAISGSSIQRTIIHIPSHSSLIEFSPLFHQVQFSGIYRSSLDIYVSQILCESRLILKKDSALVDNESVSSSSQATTSQSIMAYLLAAKRALKQPSAPPGDSSSTSSLEGEEENVSTRIRNSKEAVMHQIQSLLKIFYALSYHTNIEKLLSRFQLLSDISLPWNALLPDHKVEVVMDLVPLKTSLEKGFKEYYSKTEMELEYAQKALSTLSKACVLGATDLLAVAIPLQFENTDAFQRQTSMEKRERLDQFYLKRPESEYLQQSFLPPPSVEYGSRSFPSISQYHPKPAKNTWMVKIIPDKPVPVSKGTQEPDLKDGIHLVIFVHGLLGHSNDLRPFRAEIIQLLQNEKSDDTEYVYFFSKVNQENTFDHLITMGSKLAAEIGAFIDTLAGDKVQYISFVGHSLGGLISRVAIRLLNPLKDKFHTFVTFGSPHLSLALNDHILMGSFLGLYQTLYSADCINQLYMTDHDDKRECLLYKLSEDTNLQSFKNGMHVFASEQDQYVHFEGALLSNLCVFKDYSDFDPALKPIYREMQRNMVGNCKFIHRYQIYFEEIDKAKSTWGPAADPLGRMAHIALLTNQNSIALAVSKTFMRH